MVPLFLLEGVFETLNELGFVVQVIVFSYLLFWLYLTFREAQLLFGVTAIIAGYMIFIHGLSVTVLAILFLLFVVLGSHLQMLIQFGIMPLLGFQHMGDRFGRMHQPDQERLAEINAKMASGQMLSQEEYEIAHQQMGASQQGASQQQMARERSMMGG